MAGNALKTMRDTIIIGGYVSVWTLMAGVVATGPGMRPQGREQPTGDL